MTALYAVLARADSLTGCVVTHSGGVSESTESVAGPERSVGTEPDPGGAAEGAGSEVPAVDVSAGDVPAVDVPDLPEAPVHPPVDPALARVEMFGAGELPWQPVSMSLRTTRTITLLAWLVPLTIAAAVAAVLVNSWFWITAGLLVVLIVWGLWIIGRQVSAISYLELEEDLVIRKGRLFRQVSSIPYGRLQYVDLQSGPLERKYGMATLEIFTASPASSATIPGLVIATAEEMRERLMQRGEAQRAGL